MTHTLTMGALLVCLCHMYVFAWACAHVHRVYLLCGCLRRPEVNIGCRILGDRVSLLSFYVDAWNQTQVLMLSLTESSMVVFVDRVTHKLNKHHDSLTLNHQSHFYHNKK